MYVAPPRRVWWLPSEITFQKQYLGRKVAVYRSLKSSGDCVGTWCEFARMHYLTCVLLPEDANEIEYSGSLVNNITGYVFLDQIIQAGRNGVVCTAGNSATGRSLLGVCEARNFPIISIVRTESGREALAKLGAQNVLVTADARFDSQLQSLSSEFNAAAVFDGVGGALLGRVAKAIPSGSTAYCYGFLAGDEALDFASSLLLIKSLTLTSFSILRPLVRNAETLKRLLSGLEQIIAMPHFKTPLGNAFSFDKAAEALRWQSTDGSKVILRP